MTISRRIILGFAAIGVLMVLLGGYAVSQVGRVRDTLDAVVKRDMGSLDELDQLQSMLAHMVELRTTAVRQMVLQGAAEPAVLDEWGKSVVTVQHGVSVLQSEVQGYIAVQIAAERTPLWRRMAQQLDDAATNIAQLRANVETQFGAIHSGDRAAMIAQEPVVIADRKRVTDGVAAMRQTLRLVDAAGLREGGRVYDSSLYSVLGLLAVAIAVGVGVTLVTRRAITARIDDFERFAERVGAGELAVQTVTGQDEIGRLGGHLNQMVEGLRDLARQSREATVNLDGAANEIRASTQQQAAGVEEQLRRHPGDRRHRRRDHPFRQADQPPGAGGHRRGAGDGADHQRRHRRDRGHRSGDGPHPRAGRGPSPPTSSNSPTRPARSARSSRPSTTSPSARTFSR